MLKTASSMNSKYQSKRIYNSDYYTPNVNKLKHSIIKSNDKKKQYISQKSTSRTRIKSLHIYKPPQKKKSNTCYKNIEKQSDRVRSQSLPVSFKKHKYNQFQHKYQQLQLLYQKCKDVLDTYQLKYHLLSKENQRIKLENYKLKCKYN